MNKYFFWSEVSLRVCFVMQFFDLIFSEKKGFLGEQRAGSWNSMGIEVSALSKIEMVICLLQCMNLILSWCITREYNIYFFPRYFNYQPHLKLLQNFRFLCNFIYPSTIFDTVNHHILLRPGPHNHCTFLVQALPHKQFLKVPLRGWVFRSHQPMVCLMVQFLVPFSLHAWPHLAQSWNHMASTIPPMQTIHNCSCCFSFKKTTLVYCKQFNHFM